MEVYGLLASGYGDWPIIKQIAWLLGQVMNGIFNVLSAIGIENIGVCIIIFTIIVYSDDPTYNQTTEIFKNVGCNAA